MPKNNMLEIKFKGNGEAYKQYMRNLGKKGGKKRVSKGKNYKKYEKQAM